MVCENGKEIFKVKLSLRCLEGEVNSNLHSTFVFRQVQICTNIRDVFVEILLIIWSGFEFTFCFKYYLGQAFVHTRAQEYALWQCPDELQKIALHFVTGLTWISCNRCNDIVRDYQQEHLIQSTLAKRLNTVRNEKHDFHLINRDSTITSTSTSRFQTLVAKISDQYVHTMKLKNFREIRLRIKVKKNYLSLKLSH